MSIAQFTSANQHANLVTDKFKSAAHTEKMDFENEKRLMGTEFYTENAMSAKRVRKNISYNKITMIHIATWGICNNMGSVHGERANFTKLVLGCIEAKFCT